MYRGCLSVEMNILDIKLTYQCNNRCILCCQSDEIKVSNSRIELKDVERFIESLDIDSIRDTKVVLTGGEPTLHRDILGIIKVLKQAGVRHIQIQSNATFLTTNISVENLINEGVDSFGISLHGNTSEMHENFTCTKGSFERTVSNLKKLSEGKIPVAINCVISKYNVEHLSDVVKFVSERNLASSIQFAFIHIMGRADNHHDLIPSISEAARSVKDAIRIGSDNGISVKSEAIPFCLMGGYEKHVSEIEKMDRITILDKNGCFNFSEHRENDLKAKDSSCRQCLFYSMCEGPWIEYPEYFGWSEFVPVRNIKNARNNC